jgi:hypothetical protein
MRIRDNLLAWKLVVALLGILFLAGEASAYVGPAPGPEFVGYFMSLLAWLGLAFSALLIYPLHALRKRFKRGAVMPIAASQEPAVTQLQESSTRP